MIKEHEYNAIFTDNFIKTNTTMLSYLQVGEDVWQWLHKVARVGEFERVLVTQGMKFVKISARLRGQQVRYFTRP